MIFYKITDKNMNSIYNDHYYELNGTYIFERYGNASNIDYNYFHCNKLEDLTKLFIYYEEYRIFKVDIIENNNIIRDNGEKYIIKFIEEVSYEELKSLAFNREVELGYKLSEILFPYDPSIRMEIFDVSKEDILNLKECKKINKRLKTSIEKSVTDSICDSIYKSAFINASHSIIEAVHWPIFESVYAYIGSLFPNIIKWKDIKHKKGIYPYQCYVNLYKRGFIPHFIGDKWVLYTRNDITIYDR